MRRATKITAERSNLMLARGEPLVVYDGNNIYLKIGDGKRRFNDLPYVSNPDNGEDIVL